MEVILNVMGLIVLFILLGVQGNTLQWKPSESGAQWFASRKIKEEIKQAAKITKLDGSVVVGLSCLPLVFIMCLLVVQTLTLFTYTNYLQDRQEFILRRGDSKMPPGFAKHLGHGGGGRTMDTQMTQTTQATMNTMQTGMQTDRGTTMTRTQAAPEVSATMPRRRGDENWVGSSRKPETATTIGARTDDRKTNVTTKKGAASEMPYASVHPPSASSIDRHLAKKHGARSPGRR